MGTTRKSETEPKENIVDDITEGADIEVEEKSEKENDETLAALKAKMAAKQKEKQMPPEIVEEPTRSIRLGVIGSGQAGSRLAECFYSLGYPSVAINTAKQDLQHIQLPDANKLLLDYGLGGAAKELDIGHAAAETYRDAINQLVMQKLNDAQVVLFCTSLGGGSGAGSTEIVIDILAELGTPVAVITVLPQSSDDAQTKANAVKTLSKLTHMAQNRKIDNLIVVDNAKIEAIYSDVGPLQFFPVSNRAIVDPIDKFNTLSAQASAVKGLDPTEFGKLFTDGQGLTVYGKMIVENYQDETAIAEAVIEDLNGSLLASGFNLKQARYVGAIFSANQKVWDKIPNASVNYAVSMINDACGNPLGVFKGIYADDSITDDAVHVYSMFSGLGLPDARIDQLKTEAKERMALAERKDEERKLTLKVDAEDETVSAAQAVMKKIDAKKSSFGKLHGKAILDRRKK